ncbi:hypothetical protein ACOSP7_002650 [Xanthoceras sorbifolium]
MENSMNSYLQQKPGASRETTGSPDHDDDDDQESGWTAYFDDFSNHRENSFCSSYIDSSSLVSDAAYSGAAWNHLPHNNHHHHHLITACSSIGGSQKIPKKLKFMKKTRTKEICEDDSLEDTASSPVNSPKVSDLEPIDMGHPRKADHDHMYSSLGKGAASEQYYSQLQREERSMNNSSTGKNNDCTDLNSRGLCLFPLSMPFI